ncbi:hypothetical protein R3P38DRAFT_2779566 [Favolaschia claudopus]|uniref:Uncharacterized protein n=1 Tax=Favolaschia claudopus TaxID=2862362 RepID=A0AAW0BFH3_9AGAR
MNVLCLFSQLHPVFVFVPGLATPHYINSVEPASQIAPLPIVIFDVVAIVASVSLALTLAPALLSPVVHRSKTWLTMIIAMMTLPPLYLLNVGSQFDATNAPPIGLCILQAGFIYAGFRVTLVQNFQTTLGLRAVLFNTKRSSTLALVLVIFPSMIFAGVFFEAIVLVNGSRGVHFDPIHMFCESDQNGPQVKISAVLTMLSLILTLGMEFWTVVILYRNWAAVRSFRRTKTDIQLSVLIRLGAFTLTVAFAAALGVAALPNNLPGGASWNIFLVTVPLLAALAFGTRRASPLRLWWH